MEVYIARQPIFDRKMNVYAYELLYRRSMNNFYEGTDDAQATATLINNAFLVMEFDVLTSGTRAFINFSEDMLEQEIPLLLPPEEIVVEVLERVEATEKIIEVCQKLKEAGYIIALDDFVFHKKYMPLMEAAHIIKIEFNTVSLELQSHLIKQYGHRIKFLAEKIETREEFQQALDMGYSYFQGYFFSKPVIIKGKELEGFNANLMRVLDELNQQEPNYQRIAEIIERDLGLSYKLLRVANSIFFGSRHKIYSIKQALVRLGIDEIKKWVYLMMLKDVQIIENKELIRSSLIRGKFMELLALELELKHKHLEFFMTGMFSSIDVLLNRRMPEIVNEIPLTDDVGEALLGHRNKLRKILDIVIECEKSNWNHIEVQELVSLITRERFTGAYIGALKWVMEIGALS